MEDCLYALAIFYLLLSIFDFKCAGVRRVMLPLGTACKAGASLFSHGPNEAKMENRELRVAAKLLAIFNYPSSILAGKKWQTASVLPRAN